MMWKIKDRKRWKKRYAIIPSVVEGNWIWLEWYEVRWLREEDTRDYDTINIYERRLIK